MFSKLQLTVMLVVVLIFGAMGTKMFFMEKQITTCKANTKIQKELYKKAIDGYEHAIENIELVYKDKLSDVDNFERRANETDCDASYRFFNRSNY